MKIFNKKIQKLCETIGSDLAKLHKGDTASALWPFVSNEAEFYMGEFFIKDLYSSIISLKNKGYSNKKIAILFYRPSKIAQYFSLFHSAKCLKLFDRRRLVEFLINFISYYREDPFCRGSKNILKKDIFKRNFLDLQFSNKEKDLQIEKNISALLLLYLEMMYPTMKRLGHEFHGPYKIRGRSFFVKEFYNLKSKHFEYAHYFPFDKITLIEETKDGLEIDFFNHLFSAPNRKAILVLADGKKIDLDNLYESIKKGINKINSLCFLLTKKDWLKILSRGIYYSIKPLKDELNKNWFPPKELFKKIDNKDFSFDLNKVKEFIKKTESEELKKKITKSFYDIFVEENKTIELHVTSECSNKCVFCSVRNHPFKKPTKKQLIKNIYLSNGYGKLSFSGGEPTLREDLLELIKYSKKFYEHILLETNGLNLNEKYIQNFINSGLTELKISIHGSKPEIHDLVTSKKGSFKIVHKSLDNLSKFGNVLKVKTNTVITKYNKKDLVNLVSWIDSKYPYLDKIQISYPRFYKFSHCKDHLVPLNKLRKTISEISALSNKLVFENIPLCILNTKFAANYHWNSSLAFNGQIIDGIDRRTYPKICEGCNLKENCQGIHNFYDLYFEVNKIKES